MHRSWTWFFTSLLVYPSIALAQIEIREPQLQGDSYSELAGELHEAGVLREFASAINEAIELPEVVTMQLAECGQANAFYDPNSREISMCLELLEGYYQSMASAYDNEDDLHAAAWGAFTVVLFHELGHALVDVLDLPITGREEDAVDQLAAWVMIDDDSGDDAVLDAALSYYLSAEQSGNEFYEGAFADEHSLDQQRFYNMVCWVYGSNPDKYAHLVADGTLPEARAQRCPGEYEQIDRSWSRLLGETS